LRWQADTGTENQKRTGTAILLRYITREEPYLPKRDPTMTGIESLYNTEEGKVLIEIKLSSIIQLYNSFDPAPFHEKELDDEAEQYIVNIVRDFPKNTEFKIVIYLPDGHSCCDEAFKIPAAIRNHFSYRTLMEERKFRERVNYGKFSILIGISFLAVAMVASQAVEDYLSAYPPAHLAAIALEVAGWVAMWEPVTVFLYQLWPILVQKNLYGKISRMETEIRPYPPLKPA